MTPNLDILYEDNHLLAVAKPGGLLAQGDRTGDPTALDLARAYVKASRGKPGNVFLGLVHRLDRPVSGVLLFARTSKAAGRLARAFAEREVEKTYLAVVVGEPRQDEGTLTGYIERAHLRSRLATRPTPDAREATLSYRVLERRAQGALLVVVPETGRHHQIRLQLGSEGMPIAGDLKYGAPEALPDRTIALHAVALRVPHPVRDERVDIVATPPATPPWSSFARVIESLLATLSSPR
jgi:23S rRNA pseudouridine1911/1915/1917 synthase